jgi:hypothetical protein
MDSAYIDTDYEEYDCPFIDNDPTLDGDAEMSINFYLRQMSMPNINLTWKDYV